MPTHKLFQQSFLFPIPPLMQSISLLVNSHKQMNDLHITSKTLTYIPDFAFFKLFPSFSSTGIIGRSNNDNYISI